MNDLTLVNKLYPTVFNTLQQFFPSHPRVTEASETLMRALVPLIEQEVAQLRTRIVELEESVEELSNYVGG